MNEFNLSNLTNKELEHQLYSELLYYSEDLDGLCRIIRRQLPKRILYRLISKLYRIRGASRNG